MKTANIESGYAWLRLAAAVGLSMVGGLGMYIGVVAMPAFQADFGVSRGDASLPFTMVMVGFGLGGIIIGRIVDRYGIVRPLAVSIVALGASYLLAARVEAYWMFAAVHALIGCFGCASVFAPLVADISKWFTRRRGLAIAICACGGYLAGVVWPPIVYAMIADAGWRETYTFIGIASMGAMLPLLVMLRRQPVGEARVEEGGGSAGSPQSLGLSPTALLTLLSLAGFGCCTAMAIPQVHLVSICGDRGYGVARGAEMLSLMLGCGVISRLGFGWISDHLGGLRTILLGSTLQCVGLVMFLPADSLVSLYIVSAVFGLFQGGIVPCYALIIREYFPPVEAGSRLGIVILASVLGMAFGGWVSGVIFDWTGSYAAAFLNGIGWNLANISIVAFLLSRARLAPVGLGVVVPAGY